jgi:hypothetical protein
MAWLAYALLDGRVAQALQLIGAIEDGPPPCLVVKIPGDGFAES